MFRKLADIERLFLATDAETEGDFDFNGAASEGDATKSSNARLVVIATKIFNTL